MELNITAVSWPSLYNPAIELSVCPSHGPLLPIQPGGYYLVNPDDIFRFTLYWTLIFHIPFYAICGIYAFLNFAFPPSRRSITTFPLEPSPHIPFSPDSNQTEQWIKRPRPNVRRSRLTFALLVILAFLFLSLTGAVMGAAVVGFVLAGVYKAGGFYMSTWVPFVWAVIQSLVGLLAIWPSVITII
ncbi:uncharacterized protein EDB93DRAFT_1243620 [Suillus bovinus]|uniref:uncharacterized protein n=1 Tax=Suillus bovinus TaxID=48563 RepID=UPI001B864133|nr:uncharacterized protein EDB93DRAFT_1243620 [Suillus bovinus]KAG2127935.1 hypothetical protein EDB93DRAFT_1243620 [Suillus bovinus]